MASTDVRHSIRVVSRRTGLTVHAIRAWERRYATVRPVRSGGNQRLYTEGDVERLTLLKRLTDAGHGIGVIANLSGEELAGLARADAGPVRGLMPPGAGPGLPPGASRDASVGVLLERAIAAVAAMDAFGLEAVLEAGAMKLGMISLLTRVIGPLTAEIGVRWHRGEWAAAHEHVASAVLRTFLANAARPFALHPGAPVVVAATPAGQLHELGALLAAAAAATRGWRPVLAGPSLPAEEIARVAVQAGARAVALSLVHPSDDPLMPREISRLRQYLPAGVALIAGGGAAPAYAGALRDAGAVLTTDLEAFALHLDRLRQGSN